MRLIRTCLVGGHIPAFYPLRQGNSSLLMIRVFSNGLGDLGLIPARVIPNNQEMVIYDALLNTWYYEVRVKFKLGKPGKGAAQLKKVLSGHP